jgi:hypothetical protein
LQDTEIDLGKSPFHRGLSAKPPYHILPLDRNRTAARATPAALEDGAAGDLEGEELG